MAVATFVLLDLVVRVAAPHLPRPQEWPAPEAEHKVEQMSSWAGDNGHGGIVLVGDSMTDDGLNPAVIDTALGQTARTYNAALAAMPPTFLAPWTEKIVVPKLRPKTVVIGVGPGIVNANAHPPTGLSNALLDSGPMRHALGTERVGDTAIRVAGDVSAIFRYRRVLRRPTMWTAGRANGENGAAGVFDPILSPAGMAQTGAGMTYGVFEGHQIDMAARKADIAGGPLHDFAVGRQGVDGLVALAGQLRRAGAAVVLVDLPLAPDAIDLMPHGRADRDAMSAALAAAARSSGAAFVDGGVWDTSFFGDPIHLNDRGAARLSQLVAPALR